MASYLGAIPVTNLAGTPYDGFTQSDWAMRYIERYGQIEGGHHKSWVLDQVARILKGTPVEVILDRWSDGKEEYNFVTAKIPSAEYLSWVEEMRGDDEYNYDEGCAP